MEEIQHQEHTMYKKILAFGFWPLALIAIDMPTANNLQPTAIKK